MQGVLKIDFYVFIVTETWPAYSISISIRKQSYWLSCIRCKKFHGTFEIICFITERQRQKVFTLLKFANKKSMSTTFKDGGWGTLNEQAAQWSVLNLPYDEKLYPLTRVFYNIKDTENAFGKTHVSCRTSIRTKMEWATLKYRLRNEDDSTGYNPGEDIFADEQGVSRRSVNKYLTEKKLCFVCNLRPEIVQRRWSWEVHRGQSSTETIKAQRRIHERQRWQILCSCKQVANDNKRRISRYFCC